MKETQYFSKNSLDGAMIIIIIVFVGWRQVLQSSLMRNWIFNFDQEQLLDTTADDQNLTRQWWDTIPGPLFRGAHLSAMSHCFLASSNSVLVSSHFEQCNLQPAASDWQEKTIQKTTAL